MLRIQKWGDGGSVAKSDPGKTFVTAQRMFGGVRPLSFFIFLAEVHFACHIVLRGAPTACSAVRRLGAPAPPCFSYELRGGLKGLAFHAAPPHSMNAKKFGVGTLPA